MELWMGGAASVIAAITLLNWRFGKSSAGDTFGTSRWATPFELFHKGAFKKGGIRVGDIAGRKSVYYHGSHSITFGTTGSGKGSTAIMPTLLEREFIFLIDPGGENTAVAAKHWRAAGYYFACISPFGEFSGKPSELPVHGFNPFALLDTASPNFLADVANFADMLTPAPANESGAGVYFRLRARAVFKGQIVHIMTTEPKERQHLGTLYEYMALRPDKRLELLRAMQSNTAFGGIVVATANTLRRGDESGSDEAGSLTSTIEHYLEFLDDPAIRRFLSRNDVDFAALKGLGAGKRGAVFSVILPLGYINSHKAIQRLAIACAIKTLQTRPLAKSNVLFLIDEAASLGRIDDFPLWLSTLRKFNVSIWSFWQDLPQVKGLYGHGWEDVLGNCDLKQYLRINDVETAKHAEAQIGRATVYSASQNHKGERSLSQCARPLKLLEEFRTVPLNQQIVLMDNLQPIRLKKTPYWARPEFAERYEDNPFLNGEPSSQPGVRDALMALWGDVYGALVWWMAPSKPAMLIYLLLALIAAFKLHAVL